VGARFDLMGCYSVPVVSLIIALHHALAEPMYALTQINASSTD